MSGAGSRRPRRDRDPAHVLLAGTRNGRRARGGTGAGGARKTAVVSEMHAAAVVTTRRPASAAGSSRLPTACTRRRETASGRGLPGRATRHRAVAVVPDADAETSTVRALQARESVAREAAGALRARLEDQALARRRPPLVADAGAGEVDDGIDPSSPAASIVPASGSQLSSSYGPARTTRTG